MRFRVTPEQCSKQDMSPICFLVLCVRHYLNAVRRKMVEGDDSYMVVIQRRLTAIYVLKKHLQQVE